MIIIIIIIIIIMMMIKKNNIMIKIKILIYNDYSYKMFIIH